MTRGVLRSHHYSDYYRGTTVTTTAPTAIADRNMRSPYYRTLSYIGRPTKSATIAVSTVAALGVDGEL